MKKEIKRQNQVEGLSTSSSSRIMEEVDANLVSTSVGKEDEEERHQSAECDEELSSKSGCSSSLGQKKRRLSVIQVKALVKDFETENKLDSERKVRLAQELGLRPNQIAIWFQNRRARSKTKQLESDYDALKARHGALKLGVDSLRADREALIAKLKELKAKLADFAVATTMEEAKIAGEGGGEEATGCLKDSGTRDIDSSTVFGEEASPNYSSVFMGPQHCLLGTKSHWSAFLFDQHHGLLLQEGDKYLEEGFSSGEEVCANLSSDEQATDEILECAPRVWGSELTQWNQ